MESNKRADILEKAKNCVCGSREEDYGSPEDNFSVIATMRNAFTRTSMFTAEKVAAMLSCVKLARIGSGRYKEDNWVDLAGYAACGGEIAARVGVEPEVEQMTFWREASLSQAQEGWCHGVSCDT